MWTDSWNNSHLQPKHGTRYHPKEKHVQKAKGLYLLFFCEHAYFKQANREIKGNRNAKDTTWKKHHQHDKVKEKTGVPGKGHTACREKSLPLVTRVFQSSGKKDF